MEKLKTPQNKISKLFDQKISNFTMNNQLNLIEDINLTYIIIPSNTTQKEKL